jgi:hypothetical protein
MSGEIKDVQGQCSRLMEVAGVIIRKKNSGGFYNWVIGNFVI